MRTNPGMASRSETGDTRRQNAGLKVQEEFVGRDKAEMGRKTNTLRRTHHYLARREDNRYLKYQRAQNKAGPIPDSHCTQFLVHYKNYWFKIQNSNL